MAQRLRVCSENYPPRENWLQLNEIFPQQSVEIQQQQQQQFESSSSFQQHSTITSSTTNQQVLNGSFEVSETASHRAIAKSKGIVRAQIASKIIQRLIFSTCPKFLLALCFPISVTMIVLHCDQLAD